MSKPANRFAAILLAALCSGALGIACSARKEGPAPSRANQKQDLTRKGNGSGSSTPKGKETSTPHDNRKSEERLSNADPNRFSPGDFGVPTVGLNNWLPLKPGMQTIRKGLVTVGSRRLQHVVVNTVTDVSKRIAGVRTVIVLDQDFNGGQIAEQALDYLAEDKHGNVWYLGSYTETYEGGQFVNATDGWLAGVAGSRPGILMLAQPKPGIPYFQSDALGEGLAAAQVIKTGQSKCVPFKCYKDVVVIQEGGEGDAEYKYFAPGVGGILTEPHYSGGEQETELLINVRQLSARGLTEISREALKVDRHATDVVPDVFDSAAAATRSL